MEKQTPEQTGLTEANKIMYEQILEDQENGEKFKKKEEDFKKKREEQTDAILYKEGYLNVPRDDKEKTLPLALAQREKRQKGAERQEESNKYQKKLDDFQKAADVRKKINEIPRVTMEHVGIHFKDQTEKREETPSESSISFSPQKNENVLKRWWKRLFG